MPPASNATKQDFLTALRQHLEDKHELPTECPGCGAALIYFDAQFRLYEDAEHFTIPLGFCSYCDKLRPAREAVA